MDTIRLLALLTAALTTGCTHMAVDAPICDLSYAHWENYGSVYSDNGPHEYGGSIWAVLTRASDSYLTLWQSTDNGATWTEVVAVSMGAGTPNTEVQLCKASSKIYAGVRIPDGTNHSVWKVVEFDLTGPTGSVLFTSASRGIPDYSAWYVLFQQLTGGTFRFIHGENYTDCAADGTWTYETALVTEGTALDATMGAAYDSANDRIHVFYMGRYGARLWHKSLAADGTTGTMQELVYHAAGIAGVYIQPRVVNGSIFAWYGWASPSRAYYIARATAAATPTWNSDTLSLTETVNFTLLPVDYESAKAVLMYMEAHGGVTSYHRLDYAGSGSWTPDTTLMTTETPSAEFQMGHVNGGIALLYKGATQVRYWGPSATAAQWRVMHH